MAVGKSHMLTTVCSKPIAKNIAMGIHISTTRPTRLGVALDMTDPRLTSQLQRPPMPMAAHQPRAPYLIYSILCSAVWAMTMGMCLWPGTGGAAEPTHD